VATLISEEEITLATSGIGSTPPTTPSFPASKPGTTGDSPRKGESRASEGTEGAAAEARRQHARDSQKQLEAETARIRQAKEELSAEVDRVHDEGEVSIEAEQEKNRARLAAVKQKGYEQLRDLQRRQQAEMNRVKREGDEDLTLAQGYYRDKAGTTIRDGEKDVDMELRKSQQQLEYIRTQAAREQNALQSEKSRQLDFNKKLADEAMIESQRLQKGEMDRLRETGSAAIQSATDKYQTNYTQSVNDHQASLQKHSNESVQHLKQLRLDTAQKLNAYSARQEDPFYRMMETGAKLSDEGDSYVLTARIPVHEQEHVKVDVRGNSITVSGQRRNEERVNIAPGRTRTTGAYQSYSESFPLTFPVEGKYLTKEFDGETLIARVPKVGGDPLVERPRADTTARRIAIEKPDFPENLPIQSNSRNGGRPLG